MKKMFIFTVLFSCLSIFSLEQVVSANSVETTTNYSGIAPRVEAITVWFKDVPPKSYRGKQRINYYPSLGGYIGVYL